MEKIKSADGVRGVGTAQQRPLGIVPTVRKRLRRVAHFLIYQLYVRRATRRVDQVSMFGLSLRVPPTVFHPAFYLSSRFLGRYVQTLDLQGKRLLDMGCGSGIQGLIAARRGAQVTAVDINPEAAATTEINACANHLDGSVRVIRGDLFEELGQGELFDYIVWNPPFFPLEPVDDAARAWNAGREFGVISRFASGAGRHLCPGGKVVLVLSSDTDRATIRGQLTASGLAGRVVQEQRRSFETLTIFEFS